MTIDNIVDLFPKPIQPVLLDEYMISILRSLLQERQQAQFKIDKYIEQCALSKGLTPSDWRFDDSQVGFVPK